MKKLTTLALAAFAAATAFAEGGNLRYSIMVNKFENKANWRGQWELGDAWDTILTDQLVQSGKVIVLVKPDKLLINRGSREGVAVGMKFDIGKVEEIVDEDTGEVLDSEMTKIGTVVVTEVKEKISYTTPLEGAEKGMGVHPAK